MKKNYMRPKSIVVDLKLEDLLLTGSATGDGSDPVVNPDPDRNPDLGDGGFPSDEEQVIPGI